MFISASRFGNARTAEAKSKPVAKTTGQFDVESYQKGIGCFRNGSFFRGEGYLIKAWNSTRDKEKRAYIALAFQLLDAIDPDRKKIRPCAQGYSRFQHQPGSDLVLFHQGIVMGVHHMRMQHEATKQCAGALFTAFIREDLEGMLEAEFHPWNLGTLPDERVNVCQERAYEGLKILCHKKKIPTVPLKFEHLRHGAVTRMLLPIMPSASAGIKYPNTIAAFEHTLE